MTKEYKMKVSYSWHDSAAGSYENMKYKLYVMKFLPFNLHFWFPVFSTYREYDDLSIGELIARYNESLNRPKPRYPRLEYFSDGA